ncbi:MAG: alkyl hydroperoxide reductase/Thiol specific antioxidant/Mal allergen [Chloroflexi bacterium]|nr:alkyl hydroperoxide reductase/Thiol specific antioxidant/Mal allergen [Chloroflexota bacterium]
MKMIKIIGLTLVVACITIVALPACSGDGGGGSYIGEPAPDFNLPGLDNQSVSLKGQRGKVVFINFWATSCPPCVDEMPHFQDLYRDWSARNDVVILTINIGEDAGTVRNFMQSNNYSFPVLLDTQLKVAEMYRIQYTPTSLVIDKNGLLQQRVIGAFRDKSAIVKTVEGAFHQ